MTTRKQRHMLYEFIAIVFAGFGLSLTIPTLISAHDTVALFAAGLLAVAFVGWVAFYLYRTTQQENK